MPLSMRLQQNSVTSKSDEDTLLLEEAYEDVRSHVKDRESNETPPERRVLGDNLMYGGLQ